MKNISKTSTTSVKGKFDTSQPDSSSTPKGEKSFLVWFSKYIKKYYSSDEIDVLLLKNSADSQAYIDEQLSQLDFNNYDIPEDITSIIEIISDGVDNINNILSEFNTANLE